MRALSDGVEDVEPLDLDARIVQHDDHHADAQQQVEENVKTGQVVGIDFGVQSEQHGGQQPAADIPPSPGKAEKLSCSDDDNQTPGKPVEDDVQEYAVRPPQGSQQSHDKGKTQHCPTAAASYKHREEPSWRRAQPRLRKRYKPARSRAAMGHKPG